jgi:hypothetical protein
MLDVIRQGFDLIDGALDGTSVLIIVFSIMAACVVRAGTGSTALTIVFVPGLIGGACTAVYLMQVHGLGLAAEKDVNLLLAITVGEALAVLVLTSLVQLVRILTAAPDVCVRRGGSASG